MGVKVRGILPNDKTTNSGGTRYVDLKESRDAVQVFYLPGASNNLVTEPIVTDGVYTRRYDCCCCYSFNRVVMGPSSKCVAGRSVFSQ